MARLSPAYRLLPWLLPKIPVGTRENLISQSRWLVIDCESSGLDPRRDKLLEVACLAVDGTQIKLADSYEGIIHQAEGSSVANILIHGISGQRQRSGSAPESVMYELSKHIGRRLVVGFHADFDRELCRRAMQRFALRRIQGSWLDLADLAPALLPDLAPQCKTLDDWLSALHIPNPARHRAAGDAFATAQLLVRLIANMAETKTALDLFKLARAHRQLALLRSTMR